MGKIVQSISHHPDNGKSACGRFLTGGALPLSGRVVQDAGTSSKGSAGRSGNIAGLSCERGWNPPVLQEFCIRLFISVPISSRAQIISGTL